jgi:RNA polymerase sigma-70 factor (ECF subfamily)
MDQATALQSKVSVRRTSSSLSDAPLRAESSDKQLVELVLAGEDNAFELIFDRHKRHVAHVASRYFKQRDEIEEIIQVSFSKAYFELKSFRGSHELSLSAWLGRIAANACIDTLRKDRKRSADSICELSESERDALEAQFATTRSSESLLIDRDLAEKLLARLPSEDRALLEMLYVEELSVAQVSEATGWSKSRIKVRAFRARNALRRVLRRFL